MIAKLLEDHQNLKNVSIAERKARRNVIWPAIRIRDSNVLPDCDLSVSLTEKLQQQTLLNMKQFSELWPCMTRMLINKEEVMVGSNTSHAPLSLVQNTAETNRTDEKLRLSPRSQLWSHAWDTFFTIFFPSPRTVEKYLSCGNASQNVKN